MNYNCKIIQNRRQNNAKQTILVLAQIFKILLTVTKDISETQNCVKYEKMRSKTAYVVFVL